VLAAKVFNNENTGLASFSLCALRGDVRAVITVNSSFSENKFKHDFGPSLAACLACDYDSTDFWHVVNSYGRLFSIAHFSQPVKFYFFRERPAPS
jgi:hypothetical protein